MNEVADSSHRASGDAGKERVVARIRAGSHLYGTATATSDVDIKEIVLPSASDILLQRADQAVRTRDTRGDTATGVGDLIELESFSLQRFLALLAAGHPIAVELLFAPESAMLSRPDTLWCDIQTIGPKLMHESLSVFARYSRQQANRYAGKGDRLAAARRARDLFSAAEARLGTQARLSAIEPELNDLAASFSHVDIIDLPTQAGTIVRHLDVCGRKSPFTASIRSALGMATRLVEGYGRRSNEAARTGEDWKAMSHAVRIAREALELFETKRLCFPLAYSEHLRDIRLGRVPYAEVVQEIEALLARVERANENAIRPASPDANAANLVARAYAEQVVASRLVE